MNQANQSSPVSGDIASYTKTYNIHTSPLELYGAVSTVRGIKGWWSRDVVAENDDITVDGSSTLVFAHAGLSPQFACYDKCNTGWNHFLGSLQGYLEQGTGTPNSGPG